MERGRVRRIWRFLYQLLYKTIFYKKWLLYSRLKITRITVIEVTLSLEAEHKRFYLITCPQKLISNKWKTIYAWIQHFNILLHYLWSGQLVKCYRLTHFLSHTVISYDEAPKWPVSIGSKKIATASYDGQSVHEYPLDVI